MDGKQYETLKNRGNDCFKAKEYEKALSYYSDAIAAKGNEAAAYSNRALCYINLNRFYEAKEDCDRAINLDPSFVKAYYRRAVALKNLLRIKQAIADYRTVCSLDPSFLVAQKEVENLQKLIEDDVRLELTYFDKPEAYRSKNPIKTFELNRQYTGTKNYN